MSASLLLFRNRTAETIPAESLLRQAAFYEERLQYLPALAMYQQAARLAEKEKDSVALSSVYRRMGNIYRNQSLKHEALQCEKKALSYISNANDSLRMGLYREIGDLHALTGEADSACYYYQIGGCRISQAKILQQGGRCREAELLLKEELEQDISKKRKRSSVGIGRPENLFRRIGRSRGLPKPYARFPSTCICFPVPDCRETWRQSAG